MKYCSKCGASVEDSAAFCSNCGAKFESVSAPTNNSEQDCTAQQQTCEPGQQQEFGFTQQQAYEPGQQQQFDFTQQQAYVPGRQQQYGFAQQQTYGTAQPDAQDVDPRMANEPTKRNLHRMAGPVWLLIIGSFFNTYAFITLLARSLGVSMFFTFLGLPGLIGGILLIVRFSKTNNAVNSQLAKQHCRITCGKCRNAVNYTGTEPKLHKRWKDGYIQCPYCRNIIGHSVYNIKNIDM